MAIGIMAGRSDYIFQPQVKHRYVAVYHDDISQIGESPEV